MLTFRISVNRNADRYAVCGCPQCQIKDFSPERHPWRRFADNPDCPLVILPTLHRDKSPTPGQCIKFALNLGTTNFPPSEKGCQA